MSCHKSPKQCCWVPPFSKKPPCTDLAISITFISVSGNGLYTFNIVNNGPHLAENVVLTVDFTGVFLASTPLGWVIVGNTGTLNLGNIPPGPAPISTLFLSSPSTVNATVASSTRECHLGNNTASSSSPPS